MKVVIMIMSINALAFVVNSNFANPFHPLFLGFSHGWVSHSFTVGGILTTTKKKCKERKKTWLPIFLYLSINKSVKKMMMKRSRKRERIGEFWKREREREIKCIIYDSKKENLQHHFHWAWSQNHACMHDACHKWRWW